MGSCQVKQKVLELWVGLITFPPSIVFVALDDKAQVSAFCDVVWLPIVNGLNL